MYSKFESKVFQFQYNVFQFESNVFTIWVQWIPIWVHCIHEVSTMYSKFEFNVFNLSTGYSIWVQCIQFEYSVFKVEYNVFQFEYIVFTIWVQCIPSWVQGIQCVQNFDQSVPTKKREGNYRWQKAITPCLFLISIVSKPIWFLVNFFLYLKV